MEAVVVSFFKVQNGQNKILKRGKSGFLQKAQNGQKEIKMSYGWQPSISFTASKYQVRVSWRPGESLTGRLDYQICSIALIAEVRLCARKTFPTWRAVQLVKGDGEKCERIQGDDHDCDFDDNNQHRNDQDV